MHATRLQARAESPPPSLGVRAAPRPPVLATPPIKPAATAPNPSRPACFSLGAANTEQRGEKGYRRRSRGGSAGPPRHSAEEENQRWRRGAGEEQDLAEEDHAVAKKPGGVLPPPPHLPGPTKEEGAAAVPGAEHEQEPLPRNTVTIPGTLSRCRARRSTPPPKFVTTPAPPIDDVDVPAQPAQHRPDTAPPRLYLAPFSIDLCW